MDLENAKRVAEGFRALFPAACYARWEIAGSVRRGNKAEVKDVEHVSIPHFGVQTGILFPEGTRMNLLWDMLESLLLAGDVEKAVYSNGTCRWGEKYRGVMFGGIKHEIFLADADNWGAILTIRTGPSWFSERLVTRLKNSTNYRQQGGYVIHQETGEMRPVPDEETFFKLCREPFAEPGARQ